MTIITWYHDIMTGYHDVMTWHDIMISWHDIMIPRNPSKNKNNNKKQKTWGNNCFDRLCFSCGAGFFGTPIWPVLKKPWIDNFAHLQMQNAPKNQIKNPGTPILHKTLKIYENGQKTTKKWFPKHFLRQKNVPKQAEGLFTPHVWGSPQGLSF